MRTPLATILRDIAEADMPISEIARYAHILSPEVIHYESDHDHLFFFPDGTSTALARRQRGEPVQDAKHATLSPSEQQRDPNNLRNQVHGATSNGSPAETEKSGQLNPAFSRWLIGLPPAWDDCAVMAMQSFRRRQRSS